MSKPLAVIIRFSGDPDDLLPRFERARELWIDTQGGDFEPPVFYAACKTDDGIAIVSGWRTAAAHRAFGQGLHPHIDAAGLRMPAAIERIQIEQLGWNGTTNPG
jgi:hypothetical protein